MNSAPAAGFAEALALVENLALEDQAELLELLRKRLAAARRKEMVREIAEARSEYAAGRARRGTAADLMDEIRRK